MKTQVGCAVAGRSPGDVDLADERVRLGVSACLVGDPVRFDGGHKRDAFLAEQLEPFVRWVAVCPEIEAGLGAPREPMRLVAAGGEILLRTTRSGNDVTDRLRELAVRRSHELAGQRLDGFILKDDSPSCGPYRVKVYMEGGGMARHGRGLFASALSGALPTLPIESEGRLRDLSLREHFLERVFAHQRWRRQRQQAVRVRDLMQFHARHKLQLLAHSPPLYAALGRLVASATAAGISTAVDEYANGFMAALAKPATRARHVNVLQHAAGHFTSRLRPAARRDLADAVLEYQRAHVPLVVPVRLMTHYARTYEIGYLSEQTYLAPHPDALKLRNHV